MTNNFIEASKQLHVDNQRYGEAGNYRNPRTMKFQLTIPEAIKAANRVKPIKSLLDHGTGQGGLIDAINLNKELNLNAQGYDPGVPKFSKKPSTKFDVVTSIDVLEHIGRKYLESTLNEIADLTEQFFFFCIDLLPASKRTNDGRNAHFLLAPSDWWAQQIKSKFKIITCVEVGMLADESDYPMHLFGCATNSMTNFKAMNEFIINVQIANKKWIAKEGRLVLRDYQ